MRKLHDFEVTKAAALAVVKRETVRKFFVQPERMQPSTRSRVETALRSLGYLTDAPAGAPRPAEGVR
jgi:DNA-binding LacI/PurR family transcriptional regulator